jgi:ABC-type sugar transport system substrate-binding protein
VAQEPGIIGQYGVDAAVAALDKQPVTPKVQTGFTIITKDNLDGEGGKAGGLQVKLLTVTGVRARRPYPVGGRAW